MPGRFTGKRGVFSGKSWSWQLGQTLDEILTRIQQGMAILQGRPRTPLTLSLNVESDAGVGPAPALDDHKHELDLGLSTKGDLPSHTGTIYATVSQGAVPDGDVLTKDAASAAGMKWSTPPALPLDGVKAFLPHPPAPRVVQAGTNITIVENGLGPIISSTGGGSAVDDASNIIANQVFGG